MEKMMTRDHKNANDEVLFKLEGAMQFVGLIQYALESFKDDMNKLRAEIDNCVKMTPDFLPMPKTKGEVLEILASIYTEEIDADKAFSLLEDVMQKMEQRWNNLDSIMH